MECVIYHQILDIIKTTCNLVACYAASVQTARYVISTVTLPAKNVNNRLSHADWPL